MQHSGSYIVIHDQACFKHVKYKRQPSESKKKKKKKKKIIRIVLVHSYDLTPFNPTILLQFLPTILLYLSLLSNSISLVGRVLPVIVLRRTRLVSCWGHIGLVLRLLGRLLRMLGRAMCLAGQ